MKWSRIVALAALGVAPALVVEGALKKPRVAQLPAAASNHGGHARKRTGIVLKKEDGTKAELAFANPATQASANYCVHENGSIVQCVDDDTVAFYSSSTAYNESHLGIELEGFANKKDTSQHEYRALARLVAWLCIDHKIPADRKHVIGEDEIPGHARGYRNPGPHFEWRHFMTLVQEFYYQDQLAERNYSSHHPGPRARGVDTSEWDGTVDWAAVKHAGYSFAITRVSDGLNHHDPTFARNYSEIKRHGMVRGVYQFFRASQNGTAQADLLLSRIGKIEPGDLPPVADVELSDGVGPGRIAAELSAWCRRIKQKTGLTPFVYTMPGWWDGLGINFSGEHLWVANWGVSSPSIPTGWHGFTIWQTSSTGSVPGISGHVDLNEFNGTPRDLRAYVGLAK